MRTIICATVLLATALPVAAQDQADKLVGGRYRLWQTDLEGEIRADDAGLIGIDIRLDRDLDLDTDVVMNNLGAWVCIPLLGRVVVDYWFGQFEGEEMLTRDITYAGQTFGVGQNVETTLDWRVLTAMFEYSFRVPFSGSMLGLRVGARAGFKVLFLEAQIDSALTEKRTADLKGGTPVLGVAAELYFATYFSALIEIDGLSAASFGGGFSGHLFDYSLVVRGGYKGFFAGVGFRAVDIVIEDDRSNVEVIEGNVRISGFFVEAGFRY